MSASVAPAGQPGSPAWLPSAPPVARAGAAVPRIRRVPAVLLLLLGVALVVGPIAGGLFSRVAASQQMLDAFAPHLQNSALDQYEADLQVLRSGADGVRAAFAERPVAAGRFVGLDEYRAKADQIDARATSLLTQIRAGQRDYEDTAAVTGFERVPFLLVCAGLAFTGAGVVLLGRRRRRAAVLTPVAVAAALLALYPLASGLIEGTRAGDRMLDRFDPIMTTGTVVDLQQDFVVLVHAVGELDTTFAAIPQSPPTKEAIDGLVEQWPAISSDLAELVGTLNDNLANFSAMQGLDRAGDPLGLSGLRAFPWIVGGVGVLALLLALAAFPRTSTKSTKGI